MLKMQHILKCCLSKPLKALRCLITFFRARAYIFLSMAFISAVTLLLILPILLRGRVYTSYYYMRSDEEIKKLLLSENTKRVLEAEQYLNRLNQNESLHFHLSRSRSAQLELMIVIITTRRKKNFNYPLQVATELDEQIRNDFDVTFFICNVDANPSEHFDAKWLSKYFLYVEKRDEYVYKDKYDKAKDDYAFCLERSLDLFKSRFILVLEDDAVPRKRMLPYLKYILRNKIEFKFYFGERIPNNDIYLAIKLYFPVLWRGFGFDLVRLKELFALGFVGMGIISIFSVIICSLLRYNYTVSLLYAISVFGFFYTIVLCEIIGRANLLEMLWIHPSLMYLSESPGSNTQAVLYVSSQVEPLVQYLKQVICTEVFAVDLAIAAYWRVRKLKVYLIEPNLFQHVGFYSSVTNTNRLPLIEYLFG